MFRSIRPVVFTTTFDWRWRACFVRGQSRKGRQQSCARPGWPCTSKTIPRSGDFEGIIPPGNYGAGHGLGCRGVRGRDRESGEGFYSGKLHLLLRGRKLKGEWILVKDKREEESGRWLLIKAGEDLPPISAKGDDTSVLSGRSMRRITEDKDAQWESNRTHTATQSRSQTNAEAHGTHLHRADASQAGTELPPGEEWTFEIKFDGYRCVAVKRAPR